ncbi:hypothetical protein CTV96_09535 [Bacillus altitudinis]|uniref:hypothetical protein n=1 Tax=Bacillus altitudinis TaxID=293387 RepID=UPI000C2325F0|nr:hypothetical protein [Bacillus altitudinis]PJI12379.1 hypothetical protein CTV96_09535 [Bacillus altitudinis]PKQ85607.1 hypothetical protein CTV98_007560 [Bacillus altitudinis]
MTADKRKLAAQLLSNGGSSEPSFAQSIADELVSYLNEWHSLPETWDNQLEADIHRWYSEAPNVFPKRPYFSPSAANACPRELYHKALNAKKDVEAKPPYQGRWTRLGTAIGDMIQRDILFMAKHFGKKTGRVCPFDFERNEDGTPVFEDFAKRNHKIERGGQTFYLYGTCDGILRYVTADGEILRVGLEIKSKQTTAAKTSLHSMREPEAKHVAQCVTYGPMYGVDYYVILYVNASKKSWIYPEGEFEKSPDIRAFGIEIKPHDIDVILDRFVDIRNAVDAGTPPALDLGAWTFNNYKTTIAKSLTDAELQTIREKVAQVRRSGMYASTKQQYAEALTFIERVREGEAV